MAGLDTLVKAGASGGLGASLGGPLGWGILGANVLSGLFGGLSGDSQAKKNLKEQQRQFNISQAGGPTRALEMLPLRDRLLHILMTRFGPNPTTYADAQNAYTPGAGGTGRSGEIYEEMLRRMGYGAQIGDAPPQPTNKMFDPGTMANTMRQLRGGVRY